MEFFFFSKAAARDRDLRSPWRAQIVRSALVAQRADSLCMEICDWDLSHIAQTKLQCPGKHDGLYDEANMHSAPHDGVQCGVCKERVLEGARLHGCRICDWDACAKCASRKVKI